MKRGHLSSRATFTGGGRGGGESSSNSNRHHTSSAAFGSKGVNKMEMSLGSSSAGKSKKLWDEAENDAGLDELMAVLGYKVKSSDMAEVAQKLEQLEEVMGSVQEEGLSQLASETVHYNPSDLSSWLESMISELNTTDNSPLSDPFMTSSSPSSISNSNRSHQPRSFSSSSVVIFDDSSFDSDLTAIPGKAVYPPPPPPPPPPSQAELTGVSGLGSASYLQPPNKRLKSSLGVVNEPVSSSNAIDNSLFSATELTQARQADLARPVVLVDSQENGVRLVHTLMACAEAVQSENFKIAEALVKRIGFLAVSQAGAMRKVATYFAEALARKIYKLYPPNQNDSAFTDYLQMHFYETCPYLKFAHFTANQAILEAFAGKSQVHVIDFGIKQGMQWPALLQALALRPGGPPSFRLTGIGPPLSDDSDHLQEVGWKLAQLADTINVKFEYRGFVASSLADLDASMLDVREGETIAVNSIFELHQMLARPGAIEKVLALVRDLSPVILTVVEQEANHNGPVFLERFTESLHYYSTLFDSLEGCGGAAASDSGGGVSDQDKVMSEVYLGRQICNVVACEGVDRVERHETLTQWRTRFGSTGFETVHLGSNAFKQASMLLALFNGDGYRVEENGGCLLLGWHTKPLIATSAWKLR